MAWTYDVSTSAGQVRLLATDFDDQNPIFSDAEIDAFLSLEDSNVRRAAALALETIASQELLILKVVRISNLSTSGNAVSAELRALAATLRQQALDSENRDGSVFDWAELVTDEFTFNDRVYKQAQRQGF